MILGTRRHRTCGLEARERLSSLQIQHWDENVEFLFLFFPALSSSSNFHCGFGRRFKLSLAKFLVATVGENESSTSDQSA